MPTAAREKHPIPLITRKIHSAFIPPRQQSVSAINGIDYGSHLRHFASTWPREFYHTFDQGWSRNGSSLNGHEQREVSGITITRRCVETAYAFLACFKDSAFIIISILSSISVYFRVLMEHDSSSKVLAFCPWYRFDLETLSKLVSPQTTRCIEDRIRNCGLLIRSRNCSNVVFRTILTRGSREKHLLQTS